MTPRRGVSSWKVVTSLCLILSLIDLSQEGCADYFKLEEWGGNNLTQTIPLAQNKDPNDLLYCTLKLECNRTQNHRNDTLCYVLYDCFENDKKRKFENTTCKGPSSRSISFYHLMCLVAKSHGVAPEGCKYKNVCKLYSQVSADQTTTTTTTTTPTTTTPITESTTATSAATALSLTTTPAPPPSTPATPTPTTGTTTVKHDGGIADSSTGTRDASNTVFICSFIISVILNLVLLAVLFRMCQRTQHRTQNPTPQDESSLLNETYNDLDLLPLRPTVTEPDCPHVDSPPADTTGNTCTAGNGLKSH